MRWFMFCILAYIFLAAHVALRAHLEWRGIQPNIMLLAVVFIVLNAPREPALLGCFVLGFLQDLFTQQPLGLNCFAYGLAAMLVVRVQQIVYRGHPLTHVFMALLAGSIAAFVIFVHALVYPRLHPSLATAGARPVGLMMEVLYTAALAPFVVGILHRMRRIFGFKGPQPTLNLRARVRD